jgi:hypothetical protein
MILDSQFHTTAFTGYQYPTDDSTLHPYLSILTNDNTLRLYPCEILLEQLNDLDLFFVRDEPFLAFPSDGYARSDFIPYAREPGAKADRGWGGLG